MAKMWAGRNEGITDKLADDFNSSISFDCKMYKQDIQGSIAHAIMLGSKNIISKEESEKLVEGLTSILEDLESGKLAIDYNAEDIHMFVEQVLTERLGEVGKKLHTARSRNDQVALDLRMYLKVQLESIKELLKQLVYAIVNKAEQYKKSIMPGYTHLQRAQPITFGHQLLAYACMFLRDIERVEDCYKRTNVSPIGSCALAGTTYDTDRHFEAKQLGFDKIAINSIDGVSDRDYCVEFLSTCSLIMMHLSRFSEELILWSSWEFKFITLADEYTTGSSIMPQKKNSDMAELCRGKTGRVYGDLISMLTMLKGLPLAYNKDMQEDKESVFDGAETVIKCLEIFTKMIETLTAHEDNMKKAAAEGFINATDLADYLVKKGMPFRSAYKIAGSVVKKCIAEGKTLETLTLSEYKEFDSSIEEDVFEAIDLITCVEKRCSEGGTSFTSVEKQIKQIKEIMLKND